MAILSFWAWTAALFLSKFFTYTRKPFDLFSFSMGSPHGSSEFSLHFTPVFEIRFHSSQYVCIGHTTCAWDDDWLGTLAFWSNLSPVVASFWSNIGSFCGVSVLGPIFRHVEIFWERPDFLDVRLPFPESTFFFCPSTSIRLVVTCVDYITVEGIISRLFFDSSDGLFLRYV